MQKAHEWGTLLATPIMSYASYCLNFIVIAKMYKLVHELNNMLSFVHSLGKVFAFICQVMSVKTLEELQGSGGVIGFLNALLIAALW